METSTSDCDSSPLGFPVRTKIFSRSIGNHPTDFSYSMYSDQTLLFITQLGTAGTILQATQDAAFDGSTTYSTAVLLGRRDEPLLQLCARCGPFQTLLMPPLSRRDGGHFVMQCSHAGSPSPPSWPSQPRVRLRPKNPDYSCMHLSLTVAAHAQADRRDGRGCRASEADADQPWIEGALHADCAGNMPGCVSRQYLGQIT